MSWMYFLDQIENEKKHLQHYVYKFMLDDFFTLLLIYDMDNMW